MNSLNTKQSEAVLHTQGSLLILAGAGSGKTRVLVERMIHLIQNERVPALNIFAVTFTNKAAQEMKERVVKVLGSHANSLWISTFHSACLRILRQSLPQPGMEYDSQFVIYDDTDQKNVIKKILKEKDLSDKVYKPSSIQYHINQAKNNGLGPDDFATQGEHYLAKVKEIFSAYQQELKINQAMDFGDLITNTLRLFSTQPEILQRYQNKFKYVMVDEYQDTNLSQYKLIRLLSDKHKNVCVVGDDDQSIYKFRGAEIRNILDFQKDYPEAQVIRLEQNYRSTQNILNAANGLIRNNKGRMGKELWTENHHGNKITVFGASNESEEAKFIAEKIRDLKQEYSLNEVAVFYRTNAQSRSLEDEFRKQNIPYKIYGGTRFYDRAEIKDIMAYLKVLVNPSDSISIKRILNVPARGIGKTTVEKIEEAAKVRGVSFWQVISSIADPVWDVKINAGSAQKIHDFATLIQALMKIQKEIPLNEFITHLYEATGYWNMLLIENTIESEGRKENLNEFVNVIEEFLEDEEGGTLESFLDRISLASDVDSLENESAFVTMMTIHLAKGLEFSLVFLTGMEDGLFPHMRSLDKQEDIEEERRLCYVGMTRAKKNLFLSFARERKIFGSPHYNFTSRFLDEIPQEFLEVIDTNLNRAQRISSYDYKKFKPVTSKTIDRVIDLEYSQTSSPMKRGTVVRHAIFGDGRVERLEGDEADQKITVKFKSGIEKKLSVKHAHLEILRR